MTAAERYRHMRLMEKAVRQQVGWCAILPESGASSRWPLALLPRDRHGPAIAQVHRDDVARFNGCPWHPLG